MARRLSRSLALGLAPLALLGALSGCGEGKSAPTLGSVVVGSASAPPVDQAAPGELAEGTEEAFGLTLPRRMRVVARFDDAVHARGSLAQKDVVRYVRDRVIAERVDDDGAKALFTNATAKRSPQLRLDVEVLQVGAQSEIVVRDRTRPPAEPGLNEAERWRALGLTSDGRLIDPKHLD